MDYNDKHRRWNKSKKLTFLERIKRERSSIIAELSDKASTKTKSKPSRSDLSETKVPVSLIGRSFHDFESKTKTSAPLEPEEIFDESEVESIHDSSPLKDTPDIDLIGLKSHHDEANNDPIQESPFDELSPMKSRYSNNKRLSSREIIHNPYVPVFGLEPDNFQPPTKKRKSKKSKELKRDTYEKDGIRGKAHRGKNHERSDSLNGIKMTSLSRLHEQPQELFTRTPKRKRDPGKPIIKLLGYEPALELHAKPHLTKEERRFRLFKLPSFVEGIHFKNYFKYKNIFPIFTRVLNNFKFTNHSRKSLTKQALKAGYGMMLRLKASNFSYTTILNNDQQDAPTDILMKVRKFSEVLYLVKSQNIRSEESQVVFLIKFDQKTDINVGDLISFYKVENMVLQDNGKDIPYYKEWRVFKS